MPAMSSALGTALRACLRQPGLSLGVVALYALAVGIAGGLWATVDATLLRPLPYPDAARLVAVFEHHADRGEMAVTPATFRDWTGGAEVFAAVAGSYPLDLSVTTSGLPVQIAGARVTEGYFSTWQVPAVLGRTLGPADFTTGDAVVVDHGVWQQHFGGRSGVIGLQVQVDGRVRRVVGVMPSGFRVPGNQHAWIPWTMSDEEQRERRAHLLTVTARLWPARTVASATDELSAFYAGLRRTHVELDGWSPRVRPLRERLLGDVTRELALMAAAMVCLVAVAWVNLVGLIAASWPARRGEVAVRLALGASARQVVMPFLVELALWAITGGVIGLGVARVVLNVFAAWLPVADRVAFQPQIDARVIAAVAAGLLTTLAAIALGPLLAFVRGAGELTPRRHAPSDPRRRRVIAAVQVAGSVLLTSLAVTLAGGLRDLEGRTSADADRLAIAVSLSEIDAADEARHRAFFAALLDRLAQRPEIAAIGAASYVPPAPPQGTLRFAVGGEPAAAGQQLAAVASAVDPAAFALLDLPLRRGRTFDARDGTDAPFTAVVSESFVERYLGAGDPLGRQLTVAGVAEPLTIVGVVGDVAQPLAADSRIEALIYLPFQQVPWPFMTLLVEPRGDLEAAVRAAREEVGRLAPGQAVGQIGRLHDLRSQWLDPARARTALATLLALCAVALTLVGLYATAAREVATRRREWAIRQALGATPARVVGSLTMHACATTAAGVGAGSIVLVAVVAPLLGHSADTPSLDADAVAAVAALTLTAAAVSTWWPARRAAHVDPWQALRAE